MILTEEQKRALKRVVAYMDEMYAIASPYYGCTEDANILRAMIDSSEHIREPPKMVGFDLVARIRELEAENVQLLAALDESERVVAHKTKSAAHWYDEHLQARADRVQTRRVVEQQAARIQELEDALVEERVIGEGGFRAGQCEFWYIEDLPEESCMELDGPCDWAKCPRKHELCDVAYQQLAEEGKIGPDADAKPHCWQITEERKAALSVIGNMKTLIVCPHCKTPIEFADIPPYMAVLRGMLAEVTR